MAEPPPTSYAPVWYDVDAGQLKIRGPVSPANLEAGGYEFLSSDDSTIDKARIHLWKHTESRRWYLQLRAGRGRGGAVVCSALCFTSEALGDVISRFKTVAEVL